MMMGGWLFMVILVAVVVWALSASGRAFWARGDEDATQRSALQLLEERFAGGEIDREEFERRRAVLTSADPNGRWQNSAAGEVSKDAR